MQTQKIWFITGASRGFGLEVAKAALDAGDKVVGTARANRSAPFADLEKNVDFLAVQMDVTKEKEVKDAVKKAVEHFGRIDIVLNNAGYGIVGAIEEITDAEARQQFDTNVFGVLNVIRATVPFLRKQKSGRILNVSSLFAFDPLPGWSLYASTKNAIEGISRGLSKELEPFDINVTVIEPGLFRTGFTGKESYRITQNPISDYENTVAGYMRKGTDAYHGSQPGDPSKLAKLVLKLAHSETPPGNLPIGKDSVDSYNVFSKQLANDVNEWRNDSINTDY